MMNTKCTNVLSVLPRTAGEGVEAEVAKFWSEFASSDRAETSYCYTQVLALNPGQRDDPVDLDNIDLPDIIGGNFIPWPDVPTASFRHKWETHRFYTSERPAKEFCLYASKKYHRLRFHLRYVIRHPMEFGKAVYSEGQCLEDKPIICFDDLLSR